MVPTIPAEKYKPEGPPSSIALFEEDQKISVPLQIFHLALFDAITVYAVQQDSVKEQVYREMPKWKSEGRQPFDEVRRDVCSSLIKGKDAKLMDVLSKYPDVDVIALTELSPGLVSEVKKEYKQKGYSVFVPATTGSVYSVIILKESSFPPSSVEVVQLTDDTTKFPENDLFAVKAKGPLGQTFLISSFHGLSDGTTSDEVVQMLNKKKERASRRHGRHGRYGRKHKERASSTTVLPDVQRERVAILFQ
jgi:hypothetical protein